MSLTKSLLILVLCITGFALFGQSAAVELKGEPKLAFSGKIDRQWTYNFQLGGLQFFQSLPQPTGQPQLERADLRGFLSYGFFRSGKVSLGYMYRRTRPLKENPGFEHRFSLQYSFQHYYLAWRFGHRFVYEQRQRSNTDQSRLRYRISFDAPLQGQKLDVGELYYIGANELVGAASASQSSLENRLSSALGWQLAENLKLELGGEYRFRGRAEVDALHIQSSLYWRL